jgi:RNA polymerase sigma factor (sigma-70 family)
MALDDHLFRREAGRMVAVLTRLLGVHNLVLAEDAVQEAFCRAAEVWTFRGPPDDPAAWLMATAKNRALDVLRRERTARTFAPDLSRMLDGERSLSTVVEDAFAPQAIKDDLLRMMFSCCHPRLAEDARVALILNLLCGFSIGEVAAAFVSSPAAIAKRITRGKKTLAASKRLFDVHADTEVAARLPAVQRALYLLFSEGYHGASPETAVRAELCREAMRLTALLLEHPSGSTPSTQALAALMRLGAARLPARVDACGDLRSLFDQDRSLWDGRLIAEGLRMLERSATGSELSAYHLEAAIAARHACAPRAEDTDWADIVLLYDALMRVRPSPVIALNRAVAVAQDQGPERALEEVRAIAGRDRLADYPFYSAALGEFELRCGRPDAASQHFGAALALARNPMEFRFFERRIAACLEANSRHGVQTPAVEALALEPPS